ncbi:MAG: acyl carrier protein [Spirochaetales bacterium]|nr:acyl carrier protein [Spirochaetales bacterium]
MEIRDISIGLRTIVGDVFKHMGVETDAQNLDDGFIRQNLNSINFIRLVVEIERKYQIKFVEDELDFASFDSLDKIASVIHGKVAGDV